MPIVTVYHRVDLSVLDAAAVDAFFGEVRVFLAEELSGEQLGHRLDADADFELNLLKVGDRPGEHVNWDFTIDIEAYDFDYRLDSADVRAAAIMNRSGDAFARRFGERRKFAVWLKLLKAAWVQSSK